MLLLIIYIKIYFPTNILQLALPLFIFIARDEQSWFSLNLHLIASHFIFAVVIGLKLLFPQIELVNC